MTVNDWHDMVYTCIALGKLHTSLLRLQVFEKHYWFLLSMLSETVTFCEFQSELGTSQLCSGPIPYNVTQTDTGTQDSTLQT